MARTDPLSIRQLEVFVSLVEQGSFTKAARHLQLSQSTVSGHIADLERRLDVRLVDRERSGVRPTAAGNALLVPSREVLAAERRARMAVEELSGLLRGRLVVGGSTIPASYLLPPLFARFHEAHPGVALQMITGDSRDVVERLRHAELEVGIVGAAPAKDDVVSTPIGGDELVLTVPAGHPLAAKTRVVMEDALAYPFVMREEGSGSRAATDAALAKLLGKRADDLNVACEVGSTEAMKAAVAAGLGVAFISDLALRGEVRNGTLASVDVRGLELKRRFFLVSRAVETLSPAARAFRELAGA